VVQVTRLECCAATGIATLHIVPSVGDVFPVSLSGEPRIVIDPEVPVFGPSEVAYSEAPITVTNVGLGVLTITEVFIEGNTSDAFAFQSTCDALFVGADCRILVTFDPPSEGDYTGTLVIRFDSLDDARLKLEVNDVLF
jgi:hypothetical protein